LASLDDTGFPGDCYVVNHSHFIDPLPFYYWLRFPSMDTGILWHHPGDHRPPLDTADHHWTLPTTDGHHHSAITEHQKIILGLSATTLRLLGYRLNILLRMY
jgi:hypothetical protein